MVDICFIFLLFSFSRDLSFSSVVSRPRPTYYYKEATSCLSPEMRNENDPGTTYIFITTFFSSFPYPRFGCVGRPTSSPLNSLHPFFSLSLSFFWTFAKRLLLLLHAAHTKIGMMPSRAVRLNKTVGIDSHTI